MSLINFLRLAPAVCLAITLSGCVSPNKAYRTDVPYVEHKAENYSLGFVEFDDQGELWSHDQLKAVTNRIRQASKDEDLLLVLYAHGWSGNASQELQDTPGSALNNFENTFLKRLGAVYQGAERKRHVVGVFLGWRGRVADAGAIGVDFPNRLAAAQRVANISGTEAILELTSIGRVANRNNKIIVVGHSFGGIVVESALNQAIVTRVIEAKRQSEDTGRPVDINSPVDLVVLINQAQSATIPHQLQEFLLANDVSAAAGGGRSRGSIRRPLMVSITARNDTATGIAFPLGTDVSRTFRALGIFGSGTLREPDPETGYDQKQALRRTAGHYPALCTHELKKAGESSIPASNPEAGETEQLAELGQILKRNMSADTDSGGGIRVELPGQTWSLENNPEHAAEITPYWIFSVEPDIISGHSGFWNNKVYGLISVLADLPRDQTAARRQPMMLQYDAPDDSQ